MGYVLIVERKCLNLKKITKNHFGKLPEGMLMDVLSSTLFDLFKAERRIKKLKTWNLVLMALLVLDVVAFWAPKIIK